MSDEIQVQISGIRYKVNSTEWVVDSSDAARGLTSVRDLVEYLQTVDPASYSGIDTENPQGSIRVNMQRANLRTSLEPMHPSAPEGERWAFVAFNTERKKGGYLN